MILWPLFDVEIEDEEIEKSEEQGLEHREPDSG
jgi:hypothetical protein